MSFKDFFARRRQKANDKAVLNASIASEEDNQQPLDEPVTPKKRKSRKKVDADVAVPDIDENINNQPPAEEEKTTKKTRRYKAKTKVVAQANDEDVSNVSATKSSRAKKDAKEPRDTKQGDPATDWKNRKKKNQPSQKRLLPPMSMKQLLTSSVLVYGVLIACLLVQSFVVVRQSFLYRAEYQQLNQLNEKERQLNIEWGRMLIEKQTFGSSAQIATRATMEMGMFSPSREQRIIITLPENNTSSPAP